MHSVHCMRNPQQVKITFVAECLKLLLFFDLLCCFKSTSKYLKYCTGQNRSKIGKYAEPTAVFADFRTV